LLLVWQDSSDSRLISAVQLWFKKVTQHSSGF